MTKITWGDVGDRYFEAGADRGVLYLSGVPGVPWNGLSAVNEAPVGGAAVSYYFDGYKYVQVSSSEEYSATIEAYSSPEEFAACDGTQSIANGLFVTQQPRKPFDFSYRTGIGNDVDGVDHGYKIHLVYNALAAPAQIQNSTLSDDTEPTQFSWDISTKPRMMSGVKPTSHIIIDSRKTNRIVFGVLESILYGDNNSQARMPNPAELLILFGWVIPDAPHPINVLGSIEDSSKTTIVNLATNPSFETGVGTVEVRRNLAITPMPPTGTSPAWTNLGYGTGGAGSQGGEALEGYGGGTGSVITWTTAATSGGCSLAYGRSTQDDVVVTPGIPHTFSMYGKVNQVPAGLDFRIRVSYYNFLGTALGTVVDGVPVVPTVNTQTRVSITHTPPANAYRAVVAIRVNVLAGTTAGFKLVGSAILVEKDQPLNNYMDGNSLPEGDFSFAWAGVAYASPSLMNGVALPTVTGGSGRSLIQSTDWSASGTKSLRIISNTLTGAINGAIVTPQGGLIVGKTYTVVARYRAAAAGGGTDPLLRAISYWRNDGSKVVSQAAPDGIVDAEVRLTFTKNVGDIENGIRLGGNNVNVDAWWDDVTIVEVPVGVPYNGSPFHGDNPFGIYRFQEIEAAWAGVPHASVSNMATYNALSSSGNRGDAYVIEGDLWAYIDPGFWKKYESVPVT